MQKNKVLQRKFIIPMIMGSLLYVAPQFSLANVACTISLNETATQEASQTKAEPDLDALLREMGISEEAISASPSAAPKVETATAAVSQPKQESPKTDETAKTGTDEKRMSFAQEFHANVDIPKRLSLSDAEIEKAAATMGLIDPKDPEQRKKARELLFASKQQFVKDLATAYNELDAANFEKKKSDIQAELRKHNVTANGKLLESIFFDRPLGEIDRAKAVQDLTLDYKKSLKDFMIEVTKASQKVNIKVPMLQRVLNKLKLFGGKSEQELIDEALNEFFDEMVPIRVAIESAVGVVAKKEGEAKQMIGELKKLRITLKALENEYETRITELTVIQNAIIDYIENDPALSQDPKNSFRRYLAVEVIRDIQKTIARLDENLVAVKNGILSNYTNTEDLNDAIVDLHHTSQSLKTTLAITTMDTVVQNAVADLNNMNQEMKQLILSMQKKNADQALSNGRKNRENAIKLQEYVLKHVQTVTQTIEQNQAEKEVFKRASVEKSRQFIEQMKTHQQVINELLGHLEKAEAASVDAAYDGNADQEYVKKLNLLIAVINKDRQTLSQDLLQKAEGVIDLGMKAMGKKRQTIWQQAEQELEKQKDEIK